MEANLSHWLKAPSPIDVTLLGIFTVDSAVHENARFPIVFTPFEMIKFDKALQERKASCSTVATLPGILTLTIFEQSPKAPTPKARRKAPSRSRNCRSFGFQTNWRSLRR